MNATARFHDLKTMRMLSASAEDVHSFLMKVPSGLRDHQYCSIENGERAYFW
jgi:hypothetical protein